MRGHRPPHHPCRSTSKTVAESVREDAPAAGRGRGLRDVRRRRRDRPGHERARLRRARRAGRRGFTPSPDRIRSRRLWNARCWSTRSRIVAAAREVMAGALRCRITGEAPAPKSHRQARPRRARGKAVTASRTAPGRKAPSASRTASRSPCPSATSPSARARSCAGSSRKARRCGRASWSRRSRRTRPWSRSKRPVPASLRESSSPPVRW